MRFLQILKELTNFSFRPRTKLTCAVLAIQYIYILRLYVEPRISNITIFLTIGCGTALFNQCNGFLSGSGLCTGASNILPDSYSQFCHAQSKFQANLGMDTLSGCSNSMKESIYTRADILKITKTECVFLKERKV